ncbi:MAG TPA: methyltransferase domain-containing protein [Pyrinomonadaceae bacterium]|jgi:SAM-dependent methyltransferase|nr:methyltransferase domain-containing protein [Pyrinomonadaceae bacterium]
MKEKHKGLTPAYGRYLIRFTKPFPDFDFSFIKPVRKEAAGLLNLKKGDRVLDAGCGPGGSFSFLVDAVGPLGQVVGVELSPVIAANARNRVKQNEWKNVEIIEAAAQDVRLTGTFDGLLMLAAPDVYDSEDALKNILPHLKENARVVVFGAKFSHRRLGMILNPVLRMMMRLSHSSTPKPSYDPCPVLAKHLEKLEVKEYFFGLMFLASGTLSKG